MGRQPRARGETAAPGADRSGAIPAVHHRRGDWQPSGKLATQRRVQRVQPEIGERDHPRYRSQKSAARWLSTEVRERGPAEQHIRSGTEEWDDLNEPDKMRKRKNMRFCGTRL